MRTKDQKVIKTFENAIRERMAPFVDFPIIFASALTKQRIFKILDVAKQVYLNRNMHIGTTKLNEVLLPIIEETPPPSVKGKYIKIKYCSQLPNTQIPSFCILRKPTSVRERILPPFLRKQDTRALGPQRLPYQCVYTSEVNNNKGMKQLLYVLLFAAVLLPSCSKEKDVDHGAIAAQAAKHYYDNLISGEYELFLKGLYLPDSLPQAIAPNAC